RAIAPLAKGSPALDVSFFSPGAFSADDLLALESIAPQIVRLNLSGMPLEPEHFAFLEKLINLRQLNLNYTAVSDNELQGLAQLPRLRSLMLAGTAVSSAGLDSLLQTPSLQHLYVWNTAITPEQGDKWTAARPGLVVETG